MAQPNLLFIYTDQQRHDTLAAAGNTQIQMPSLNKLAAESVLFEQAYVTQPVCQPARATLLTGLYPHSAGHVTGDLFNRLENVGSCLPELVKRGDYVCGHHGKWHLGDDVFAQNGFDDWISIEDHEHRPFYSEGKDSFQPCTYNQFLLDQGFEPDYEAEDGFRAFTSGFCARLPEEYGKPAFLARHASQFIRDNKARPFILFVSIVEPHQPYFGPRDDQHDPAQVTLPPNFASVPTEEQPLKIRVLHELFREHGFGNVPLRTERDWRQVIAKYWGNCSLVDTHVGTILDTVEECDLGDNTIVVFTSDHGEMMGSHGLRGKGLMFEESVRVPLMIRLPGQKAGKRVTGPVSHIDLMPTLLDLMGQSIPDHLQGKSLGPLLQQSGTPTHDQDVFIEWDGELPMEIPETMKGVVSEADARASFGDSVRTIVTPDGWKFNCSRLGEHELYNLEEDPIETRNLVSDPQYRSLMRDLIARIRRWQEEVADPVDLSSASEL